MAAGVRAEQHNPLRVELPSNCLAEGTNLCSLDHDDMMDEDGSGRKQWLRVRFNPKTLVPRQGSWREGKPNPSPAAFIILPSAFAPSPSFPVNPKQKGRDNARPLVPQPSTLNPQLLPEARYGFSFAP